MIIRTIVRVMPLFGASLQELSIKLPGVGGIYVVHNAGVTFNCNMFIAQATDRTNNLPNL